MKISKRILKISVFYLMIVISVFGFRPTNSVAVNEQSPQPSEIKISRKDQQIVPIRIQVPSVRIDASVIKGSFDAATKTWNVTSESAQYTKSTSPNNTPQIIYAHNTKRLFGPLKNIHEGDMAVVTTNDGQIQFFRYVKNKIVAPEDTSIFSENGETKNQLVLLTCTGFMNSKRRLLFFEPIL